MSTEEVLLTEGPLSATNITLRDKKGSKTKLSKALQHCEYFGLYFSAHWCPPCRAFTPLLKAFYEKHHESKKFEIVFISSDETEEDRESYFKEAHGDWWSLTLEDKKTKLPSFKGGETKVRFIPTLLIYKNVPGGKPELMTTAGKELVVQNPSGEGFPWKGSKQTWAGIGITPRLIATLAGGAALVVLGTSLVVFKVFKHVRSRKDN